MRTDTCRSRFIGTTALGVTLLLAACGGGVDTTPVDPGPAPPTFPTPGAGEAAVAVSVGIPAGFFATPS